MLLKNKMNKKILFKMNSKLYKIQNKLNKKNKIL